jgi:hypothetical protein
MRRISIALALTIFLLASLVAAQQTNNNASANTERSSSPTPPPGPVLGGMGTANYIALWATPNFLIDSVMYQNSSGDVGVGTTSPVATLDVNGSINASASYQIGGSTVMSLGDQSGFNLFLGVGAGANNITGQGVYNVFTGYGAGTNNNTGINNTFSGYLAGGRNTTGDDNTFVGTQAGLYNTTGQFNTITGAGAGTYIGGSKNTFTGANAGEQNNTGSQNTFIGFVAGSNNRTGNNDIYLGSIGPYSGTESSTIRIGGDIGQGYGPQTATYIVGIYGVNVGGVPVQINSNGQLGAATSSLRFKEQIRDMGDSTAALMKLRPVTFLYKPEYDKGERTLQYGLIAEEVAKVYPELVAYDNDGQPYSVRYQYLSTMLLNEVQKQYRRAEKQSEIVASQQAQIKAQAQEIESLRQQLQLQDATLEQRLSRLEKLAGNQAQTVAQK